jgi:type IX secretion system PorP/SprF family membrane protein
MKKLFFIGLLQVIWLSTSFAQQDPGITQYMFNTIYYNPGFSGVEGVTKITALHRTQWTGYAPSYGGGNAPNSQIITFSTPIFKLNSGFGGYVTHDNLGAQTNMEAQVSYAYHLGIKDGKLSLGLRGGIYSQTFDFDLYKYIDHPDPYLQGSGSISQIRPDLAVGVFWRKEKYYAGVSFNHLINSTFDFGLSQRNSLQTHVYVNGGYIYTVNFDLKVHFVTLIKSDFVKTTFDVGAIAYLKDTMWGGLSFRQSEAAILMLGYSFLKDKSLKLGYALDYIVQDQAAKQPTSHEVMLMYELPTNPGAGKKVVRTPRYRH